MSDMLITIKVNADQLKAEVDSANKKLGTLPKEKKTELKGDANNLTTAIKSVHGALLGMGIGLAAVGTLLKKGIDEGRDAVIAQRLLQSQLAATGNAAGLSAGRLTEISAELQKLSNMGDDAIIKNLTVPLTSFRNVSGEVFERTQKAVLDLNAAIGNPNDPASLKSVTIQLGKALNDPIQGLSALRRVGISFSESQIAVIKNLQETNRLGEAQGLILDELQREFGGAALATVDSSLQMKNAWGNLLEEFGKRTLPVLDAVNLSFANFFSVMSGNIGVYAENQSETQKQMFASWNTFSTAFMLNAKALGGFIIHTGSIVSGTIENMFSISRSALFAHAKTVWAVIDKLPKAVMEIMSMGSFEALKDLANGVGDNYKKVGTDVSVYLKTLDSEFQKAIGGFRNYEKEFTTITNASQVTYNKMLSVQKTLGAELSENMEKALGGGGGDSSAVSTAVSAYQKLLEVMRGYYRENELARLNAYEKELAQLEDQKKKETAIIDAAEANKEITKAESDAKKLELDAIYTEKSKLVLEKANAELSRVQAAKDQEDIRAKAEAAAKKSADEESYYNAMKFIDRSYYEWRLEQIKKEVKAMAIGDNEKKALISKMSDDLKAEEAAFEAASSPAGGGNISWFFTKILGYDPARKEDQKKIDAVKQSYSTIMSGAQSLVSGMIGLSRQRKDEDMLRIEDTAAKEKWSNERILSERQKINKKYEAEEKRLRNVQKAISITQAIINTAESMTKALTLGPILGPIMAAIIGAMGAAQIAVISAQKFAAGGLFRGKGGPKDDQNIIAVSDNEYIVNAAATKRYLPLLEAINSGQTVGSGFAQGGIVSRSVDLGAKLDKLLNAVEIMNLNLVKKSMSVSVKASTGVNALIREIDETKIRMNRNGYVPAV